MKTNNDPKLRYIVITVVSLKKSIASSVIASFVTHEVLKKEFKQSEVITDFYANPDTLNSCLVICLYETPTGEVRRRFGQTTTIPQTDEALNSLVKDVAASVGVQINTHNTKEGIEENKVSLKSVKEHDIFLHSMIEMVCGSLSEDPIAQLRDVNQYYMQLSAKDEGGTAHYIIGGFLQEYIETKKNMFRIAKIFGKQLSKADLKISTKYLPTENKFHLVEFPFAFNFGDFYIRNAFINVTKFDKNDEVTHVTIVCPQIRNGVWKNGEMFTAVINCQSDNIETSLEKTASYFNASQVYKDLITYTLKCLLYINSSECDIQKVGGSICNKKGKAKVIDFYKTHNPFDIINVGFGFHGRVYTKDQTTVSGHFRWQPCGVQYSQVKLIWIDEHLRQFKTEMETKE